MENNQTTLTRLKLDMQMRGLALGTQDAYTRYVRNFLEFSDKAVDELDVNDARGYIVHLMEKGENCASTINLKNSAIRFLFAVTLDKAINYLQLPRFKTHRKLPEILTREEVRKLVCGCSNLKHKAFILLAYGGGLRVSEIASLRISDIESNSMRIFIRGGKGGKDRYTILSHECLDVLRQYWSAYKPRHRERWLFPGNSKGASEKVSKTHDITHVLSDSIAKAFKSCLKKSGITKEVSIHSLRRSFATHLLEDGASLLQIKELLGHASFNSTAIYLQLANLMTGIVSPADRLAANG